MCNGELLQVQQRSVCNIKKRNVIEMTICVHTINAVIRIKNLHVFEMTRSD